MHRNILLLSICFWVGYLTGYFRITQFVSRAWRATRRFLTTSEFHPDGDDVEFAVIAGISIVLLVLIFAL